MTRFMMPKTRHPYGGYKSLKLSQFTLVRTHRGIPVTVMWGISNYPQKIHMFTSNHVKRQHRSHVVTTGIMGRWYTQLTTFRCLYAPFSVERRDMCWLRNPDVRQRSAKIKQPVRLGDHRHPTCPHRGSKP